MTDDPDIDFYGEGPDPDAEYICRLDAQSLETARTELNEDPRERLNAVTAFRRWISQQPRLKCPTDTLFLLQFLRAAKFSQLNARQRLEAFMSAKTTMPQWFSDIDTTNEKIQAFYSTGYLLPLPGRTPDGRTVVIQRLGAIDPSTTAYDKDSILKASCALTYLHLMSENNQVNGFLFLIDCTNFTLKHKMYWGLETAKKSMKLMDGFPARIKSIQCYNLGIAVESLFVLVKPFMPKKFQDKIVMHGNSLESVYKAVPMDMLPLEYLPDGYDRPNAGTIEEIVQTLKCDITQPEVRQHILAQSNPVYGFDTSKRRPEVVKQSFRKLIVE